MNPYQERFEKKYSGMYRAQIVAVDEELKNGIYKVRVWPHTVDVEEDYLPLAVSNLAVKNRFTPLYAGEWVWVFYENGDPHYPVIFDRCNVKDNYPIQAQAGDEDPPYYDEIEADSDIDEEEVEYEGEYNKVDAENFGDEEVQICREIDIKNRQVIFISDLWQIILSADGNLHLKFKNTFIKNETAFNLHIGDNILKINDDGIEITDSNGNTTTWSSEGTTFEDKNGNTAETTADGIKQESAGTFTMINSSSGLQAELKKLYDLISDLIDGINQISTSGPPPKHSIDPGWDISVKIKLNKSKEEIQKIFKD